MRRLTDACRLSPSIALLWLCSFLLGNSALPNPAFANDLLVSDAYANNVTSNNSSTDPEPRLTLLPRIIGGERTQDGEWPAMVALVRVSPGRPLSDRQFCGGTLIAPNWVVTAAHCMFDAFDNRILATSLRVVGGVNNLLLDTPEEETVVTNIILHPGYMQSVVTAPNDIALLELATLLPFNRLSLFTGDADALSGMDASIVGWGALDFTNPRRPVFPLAQRDAIVPIVDRATCNQPQSYNGIIAEGQICAGFAQGGVDSCVGDSGGPLIVEIGGRFVQAGVVSFGNGCALPDFYGVYTNVSFYIDWLGQFVEIETGPELEPEPEPEPEPGSGSSGGFGFSFAIVLLLFGAVAQRSGRR